MNGMFFVCFCLFLKGILWFPLYNNYLCFWPMLFLLVVVSHYQVSLQIPHLHGKVCRRQWEEKNRRLKDYTDPSNEFCCKGERKTGSTLKSNVRTMYFSLKMVKIIPACAEGNDPVQKGKQMMVGEKETSWSDVLEHMR